MYINGRKIDSDIEVIEYTMKSAEEVNEVQNISSVNYTYIDFDNYNPGTLELKCGFNADTYKELQDLIGNFTLSLSKATLKLDDLDINMDVAYSENRVENDAIENDLTDRWYEVVTYELIVISKYGDEIIFNNNMATSGSITLNSNRDTPCIIEITPTIDMIDIKIEGLSVDPIIINGLEMSKTIIVDGENRKVTLNGANAFSKTDMWQYPLLESGFNNIKFSRDKCNINIRYKPRWI